MKIRIIAPLVTCMLAFSVHADIQSHLPSSLELAQDIQAAEWSLKHSSVARTIDNSVLDNSMQSLQRAREEMALGNLRTAKEWLRKASVPLARMNDSAMTGKHPDPLAYKLEIRETLLSLLPVAEKIAAEKSASDAFVRQAREAIVESDKLLQAGQTDAARERLDTAYLAVQERIAGLRRGDAFTLPVADAAQPEKWQDGLNRVEERRAISRYLMIEARAEGNDTRALQTGLQLAEAIVTDASMLAQDRQWGRALEKLELAYAQYESSWRTAGVEW